MTITLDTKAYGSLLAQYQPKKINSEQEYNQTLEIIEKLMQQGENLTSEENSLLEVLSILVEAYEDTYLSLNTSAPKDVLLHLMEVRGLNTSDLIPIIGSQETVTEIINGTKKIDQSCAQVLGSFFHISPILFIGD
jgi:HTH-type transcriptional regulator/antitoxin HigA